jgi:RNA polymerase sigma-70 factor (ECF subfamily)
VTEGKQDITAADAAMGRYADGDRRAFDAVYDAVAPRLMGYLTRNTRNREEAEDLVSKTFLRMLEARGSFVRGAPVMPWAFAIARRLFIDACRAQRRHVALVNADGEERVDAALVAPADGCPEAALRALELTAVLEKALSGLAASQREAFEMVRFGELSYEETANVLDTTCDSVRMRCHRAYDRLRAALLKSEEVVDDRKASR